MADIKGTVDPEFLEGGVGNDSLEGRGGDDTLFGSSGRDALEGGAGNDSLRGGAGNDRLYGGTVGLPEDGIDYLYGDEGDDYLRAGASSLFDGGVGVDEAVVDARLSLAPVSFSHGGAANVVYAINNGVGAPIGGLRNIERLSFLGSDFADSAVGGAGVDSFSGGAGVDELFGEGGGDVLQGGSDSDSLTGGAGNDSLYGYVAQLSQDGAADTLRGSEGDDYLVAGVAAVFEGGTGNDLALVDAVLAEAGVTLLYDGAPGVLYAINGGTTAGGVRDVERLQFLGSAFADSVRAAAGTDELTGGSGDDTLDGAGGRDELRGGAGVDRLLGGEGNDELYGDTGGSADDAADILFGGEGNDWLAAGVAALQDGGAGVDTATLDARTALGGVSLSYAGVAGVLYGVALDGGATGGGLRDVEIVQFFGGIHGDQISTTSGNDSLNGAEGNDTLDGGGGNDRLTGGIGDDVLSGQGGNDRLTDGTGSSGPGGSDRLDGGADDDTLEGGVYSVYLGGSGVDAVLIDARQVHAALAFDYLAADEVAYDILIGGERAGALQDIERLEVLGSDYADTMTGAAGNDELSGDDADDVLDGAAGNDWLVGGFGDDVLRGGTGDDELYGQSTSNPAGGFDQLFGGEGDDELSGGVEVTYDGGGGVDRAIIRAQEAAGSIVLINGGVSDETYAITVAGPSADGWIRNVEHLTFFGGDFDDTVTGSAGADDLVGDDGEDVLSGGAGNDRLRGSESNDLLRGGVGADTLEGGLGVDIVTYDEFAGEVGVSVNLSTGVVTGAAGNDRLLTVEGVVGSAANDTLAGTLNGDQLWGGAGADLLTGLAGDDRLEGGEGGDTLDGGDGVDTASYARSSVGVSVFSGALGQETGVGADHLINIEVVLGSAFDDTLRGDGRDNVLNGGDGDDILFGGAGADQLIGFSGRDTAFYSGPGVAAPVAIDLAVAGQQNTGGAGFDTLVSIEDVVGTHLNDVLRGNEGGNGLRGGAGDDRLEGRGGNDSLVGQTGADTLDGGAGADLVQGGTENDELSGGEGNDKLVGDAGADTLIGGAGGDQLNGGAGADRFVFLALGDSIRPLIGQDQIRDFNAAEGDVIDLSALDAVAGGANDAWTIVSALTRAPGQLLITHVAGSHTTLQGDVDGDRIVDFALTVLSPVAIPLESLIL